MSTELMGKYLDIVSRVGQERPPVPLWAVPVAQPFIGPPPFANKAVRRTEAQQAVLAKLVNPGWSPEHWMKRLDYLADLCGSINPKLAAAHRKQAAAIREAMTVEDMA